MKRIGTVSVIVPVYNSQSSLSELASRLEEALKKTTSGFELVVVDDGSSDDTWAAIRKLAERRHWIRGIRLMRNYSQHDALLAGILAGNGHILVTMDDDLQHRPEDIPCLLNRLMDGYDVVYGLPHKEQHGLWRRMASLVTKRILKGAMKIELARETSAFRAFRREVRRAFHGYNGPFVDIDALLSWGTDRFSTVKVHFDSRKHGKSNYTFGKLVAYTINMMTCFSVLPLRFASIVGFFFTLFGFGVLVSVLVNYYIHGGSVPGFPFLASIISIFSGAQLFACGIIGEYLARMHFRAMGRPTSVIRETTEQLPGGDGPDTIGFNHGHSI